MIQSLVIRTPVIPLQTLDSELDGKIYLKLENLQPFGSYKIRGVLSAVKHADPSLVEQGISAASAGNMAQAVAFVARALKVSCRIYLPESAPQIKKDAILRLGANCVEMSYDEVWSFVTRRSLPSERGLFIHPVFTKGLLEGYEDVGTEVLADLPEADAVIIPFGVGGLTLGVGKKLKKIKPEVCVFACEPETATPLFSSLELGKATRVNRIPSFVDAIGTPEVLPEVFENLASWISGSLVVGLKDVRMCMEQLLFQHKIVCEGAGAASLAAAYRLVKTHKKFKKIVCIVSGGNTNLVRMEN